MLSQLWLLKFLFPFISCAFPKEIEVDYQTFVRNQQIIKNKFMIQTLFTKNVAKFCIFCVSDVCKIMKNSQSAARG